MTLDMAAHCKVNDKRSKWPVISAIWLGPGGGRGEEGEGRGREREREGERGEGGRGGRGGRGGGRYFSLCAPKPLVYNTES